MGQFTPELRRQRTTSSLSTTASSSSSAAIRRNLLEQNHLGACRSSNESHPSSSSFGSGAHSDQSDEWRRVKCVLVGDAAVGKTSLIVSYTTDGFPQEYVPTAFDNYSVSVRVNGQPVKVQLCDTAGQDDFYSLRPLCYPNADVFLLCFSVVNPTSFHSIRAHWISEIRHYAPNAPFLLIGTESDLRTNIKMLLDLSRHNRAPVSAAQARNLASEIGAIRYIECSSLTQLNLKEAFDAAILAALKVPTGDEQTRVQMHEFRGRKSLRKWKDKIVTRSKSVESMKSLRVKRSMSNNNRKMSDAQSIARLNYYAATDSPSFASSYDLKRQPRLSHSIAMPNWFNVNDGRYEKKKLCKGGMSASNLFTSGSSAKSGYESSDLAKAKKGWKKLFCVV